MQQNLEQCITDLSMIIQQEGHTMPKEDLKTLKKELEKFDTKLIELIDSVS